jgi:hypothetical protein
MGFMELQAAQLINEQKSANYHAYYAAKRTVRNTSPMCPPELRGSFHTSAAFVRLAVEAIEERITLDSVTAETPEATAYIRDVLKANGGSTLISTVHLAALEGGRAYVIPSGSTRPDGSPILTVVPAGDAVHSVDPYTGEIAEVLRVYGDKRQNRAHYTATETVYYEQSNTGALIEVNRVANTGRVPVFVFICRNFVNDTYGRPEGKDIFSLQDAATRVLTDMSVASAFMAVPQRVILGAESSDFAAQDDEGEQVGPAPTGDQLYTARLLMIGDANVKIAEFASAQLQNFSTALNSITRQAAAKVGVPQSVFGVASDANPSSGDSMRQDDARLISRAERLTSAFETSWASLFEFLIAINPALSDETVTLRWVDASLPNLAARADAISKLAGITVGGQALYTRRELLERLGESADTIDRMLADEEVTALQALINASE